MSTTVHTPGQVLNDDNNQRGILLNLRTLSVNTKIMDLLP